MPGKSLIRTWKKFTNTQKVFSVAAVFLIIHVIAKLNNNQKEGFESSKGKKSGIFHTKKGTGIYDDYYVNVYDTLLHSEIKNKYEVDNIIKNGYTPNPSDPIVAIKIGGKYVLQRAGHHRCCIIAALGENYYPQVFAPRGIAARYIYLYFQEIKWLFKRRHDKRL